MLNQSRPDQPLRQDVFRSLRRKGILPEAEAAWVVATANTVAKQRFQAVTFRDGVLTCLAGSLPVAELQLVKGQFQAAINKKIGRELVRSIRVKQE